MKTINYKRFVALPLTIIFITSSIIIGHAQINTDYIKKWNTINVKFHAYANSLDLYLETPSKLTLNSNLPTGLGVSFAHPKLPFEISFGTGVGSPSKKEYKKTKSIDIQIHSYGRKFVYDISFLNYKGFINRDATAYDEKNYYNFEINEISFIGQYIVNGNKFSYNAAYNQREAQLKSAGSLLLGAGIYLYKIKPDENNGNFNYMNIKSREIGFNFGYSYNLVISRVLTNLSFTIGVNAANKNIKSFFDENLHYTPTFLMRLSSFYNARKWSFGFTGVYHSVTNDSEKNKTNQFRFTSGRFSFTYVRRFNYKKR